MPNDEILELVMLSFNPRQAIRNAKLAYAAAYSTGASMRPRLIGRGIKMLEFLPLGAYRASIDTAAVQKTRRRKTERRHHLR